MCCFDVSSPHAWRKGRASWTKKCCDNPTGLPVITPHQNITTQGLSEVGFWQKRLLFILFQLDKGLTYLAPYFLDMIICEGLPYAMMEILKGCRPYTTTTTTNIPPSTANIYRKSKRQSSLSVSSQNKILVCLCSLFLSVLVSFQLCWNNISIY